MQNPFFIKKSEKVFGKLILGNSKFAEYENWHFCMSNKLYTYKKLYCNNFFPGMFTAGNTKRRGRLSTVDLLIMAAHFVRK